jgi:signal transduction histidine kinase
VDPRLFLNDFAALLRGALDRNTEVRVQVDDLCPLLWVDVRALEHALISLVTNARDAMPEGGRLGLHAGPTDLIDGSPGVAIAVTDTGFGMPPDVASCAASPFFTTKVNRPMAGLGLAAVQGFTRQSGGSMALQTAQGTGTTVTLNLPAFSGESR